MAGGEWSLLEYKRSMKLLGYEFFIGFERKLIYNAKIFSLFQKYLLHRLGLLRNFNFAQISAQLDTWSKTEGAEDLEVSQLLR